MLRLMPVVPVLEVTVPPVPELVVPVVVVVELMLSCRVMVALVGGLNPSVRDRSLLTCMTAMSTMTSGRALSRSSTSFSARRDLIGCPAHDQSILREQLLHALHIQHGANRIHHILQFGGRREIRKIKSLEDALFQFLALGRIVCRDEDRIQRDRAPEGLRLKGRDFERLFQRYAVQFHFDGTWSW